MQPAAEPLTALYQSLSDAHVLFSEAEQDSPGLRAAIVFVVAAWEAFVEDAAQQAYTFVAANSSPAAPLIVSRADALAHIERFHTPSQSKINQLYKQVLGLPDISRHWRWPGTTNAEAVAGLARLLSLRHAIVHRGRARRMVDGVLPFSAVGLVRRLAATTHNALCAHLTRATGSAPWPVEPTPRRTPHHWGI